MTHAKANAHPTAARKRVAKVAPIASLRFGQAARPSTPRPAPSPQPDLVRYDDREGIDAFVVSVHAANPMQLIETERRGVAAIFVKDLAKRMAIPAQRMFDILGVPKATAEKKVAAGELLTGTGGRAALGMARLLGIAQEIVADSTAEAAKGFDTARWLGRWLETPQPALGGRRPAELIETPTGLEVVARLLGALRSGAYQ